MIYYEQYLELEEDLKNQGFGVVVDYVKELHADSRSLRQEVERLKGLLEKTADTCPICFSGVTKINKDGGKRYCYNCRNTSGIDDEE